MVPEVEEGDNTSYIAYIVKIGKSGFNSEKDAAKYTALPRHLLLASFCPPASSVSTVKIYLSGANSVLNTCYSE